MKMKPKSYFNLFYIAFFIVVIIGSMSYTRKARLIPLVVAIPCLGLSIGQFVIDLGKGRKKGRSIEDDLFHGVMEKVHLEVPVEGEKKGEEKGEKASRAKPLLRILFWILVFYFSILFFGFLIAIPLFTVLYMHFQKERWKLSIACAAGLWLTVYLAFSVIAKIALYEGLIFQLFAGGE
jgi:hypothetical protein